MSKLRSDRMVDGVPERERYERFCGAFVDSGNRMHAFRLAFVVDRGKTTQWLQDKSAELLRDPDVAARVQEMRDEAAAVQIVTVGEILRDLHDIATADPNELISVNLDCCRYCNGVEHAYQWTNVQEYEEALAHAMVKMAECDENPKLPRVVLPTDEGGYGYHPANDPSGTCPRCYGRGVNTVVAHDSRKVSAKAAKLYAGVKVTAGGGLEIKMHDQMKARELVGKVLGVFKDGIPVTLVTPGKERQKPVTQEDAARAYLTLVG